MADIFAKPVILSATSAALQVSVHILPIISKRNKYIFGQANDENKPPGRCLFFYF
jgi:hypothetical protein